MIARVGWVAVALLLLPLSAMAGEQQCQGDPARKLSEFQVLGDGSQVKDLRSGLIWSRCLEGQHWTGTTCRADDPEAVEPGPGATYAEAKALARARSGKGEVWRLPTKREMLTLREPHCYNPSLNLELFPTEPAWSSDGDFWTTTPEGSGVALVSAIGTSDSWSATSPDHRSHVRLVRTGIRRKP